MWLASALPGGAVAQMDGLQQQAFNTANVGNTRFTHGQLEVLLTGAASVLLIMWFAWVAIGAYRRWARQGEPSLEAGSQVLRAALIFGVTLTVILW